jgi:hypothetical protein
MITITIIIVLFIVGAYKEIKDAPEIEQEIETKYFDHV